MGAPAFLFQAMGAGVQSTAIALLAANGVIDKPNYAVFSDTRWEPHYVYTHLDRLDREVLKPSGIELVRVSTGDLREATMNPHYPQRTPVYTHKATTRGRASEGMLPRACTKEYKIAPLYRWVRQQLSGDVTLHTCSKCNGEGLRHAPWLVKAGESDTWGVCSVCRGTGEVIRVARPRGKPWARCYIGFSADEIGRVGRSKVSYVTNEHPLIDGDLAMTRDDCLDYCAEHGFGDVQKSACVGCPYHSDAEWRVIQADERLWRDAVEVDNAIRNRPGMRDDAYLHRKRIPLEQVEFSSDDQALGSCSPFGCRSEQLGLW